MGTNLLNIILLLSLMDDILVADEIRDVKRETVSDKSDSLEDDYDNVQMKRNERWQDLSESGPVHELLRGIIHSLSISPNFSKLQRYN